MNKIFLILITLLLFNLTIFSQNDDQNLTLWDSSVEPNCEYLQMLTDNFIVSYYKDKDSVGYVVIHEGSDIIKTAIYKQSFENYSNFRRFPKDQFKVLTTKGEGKVKIEFWVSKTGEKPEIAESVFDLKIPKENFPILFSRDLLDIVKIEGKLTYLIHGCDVCCFNSFNSFLLSKFLTANPDLIAEIKIYARTKKLAEKVKDMIVKNDILDAKIPLERVKFTYSKDPNFSKEEIDDLGWSNYYFGNSKTKYAGLDVLLISKD